MYIRIFLMCCPSQFIIRKITCCNSLSLKFQNKFNYQNTFKWQILTYFENTIKVYKQSQENAVSTRFKKQFPATETKLKYIHNCIKNNSNLSTSYQNINTINKLCFSIIDSLEPLEILSILNALVKYISIVKITFYDKALLRLLETLKCGLLSDHGIVQMIYFMSLQNKINIDQIHYLRHYLPNIDSLPLIEKCILAMSLFRSNYKLDSSQKIKFCQAIEQHAEQLMYQPALLTSLCKIIRISNLYDELVLDNLSKAIITSKCEMNFTLIAHVLSLYSSENILNQKVIDRIYKESTKLIKQDINHFNIRLKDLTRFLWASSHLNVIFATDIKILLKEYLQQRLIELINIKNLGYFVDILLSLHILQCWNHEVES
jgi:hypothetical protein